MRKPGKPTKMLGLMAAGSIAATGLFAPASAQARVQDTCIAPLGCLWHDQDFRGNTKQLTKEVDDLGNTYGDQAHSVWNKSGYWMGMYEDDNYGGRCITIKPSRPGEPSRVWNLGAYDRGWRNWGDSISSVRWYQYEPTWCTEVPSG